MPPTTLPSARLDSPLLAPATDVFPWLSDQGDGTFRNPIIYADYSDPDVVRVGGDIFMTASSFNCTPGLPILHSRDLVNWTLINHALKNVPHPRYTQVQAGCGVWAPAIRFHAGKFWIFFPMPDEGIYMLTADHPAEQWSEPHLVQAGKGLIDPCPFWDDDGTAYLVHAYAGSRAGIKHQLRVRPMAPDGSKLLGEGQVVFHQPGRHPTIEGPKFLKQDGWYYILAPAGGVQHGWQVALRAKNIMGPYEDKIVLAQGDTDINGPHQGALVDAGDDGWWFVHFQDAGVYGRIVHLQPVVWRAGWPVIGRDGEPVLRHAKPRAGGVQQAQAPQASDEFDSVRLALQWQWYGNHQDEWYSLTDRKGWLRLFSQPNSHSEVSAQPNLLLQKFPARAFMVDTEMEPVLRAEGEESGLVVMGAEHAFLAVRQTGRNRQIIFRMAGQEIALQVHSQPRIRLRLRVEDGGRCQFGFDDAAGNAAWVPEIFQARAGTWIGAKVGIYSGRPVGSEGGHADFDYFRFAPANGDELNGNP